MLTGLTLTAYLGGIQRHSINGYVSFFRFFFFFFVFSHDSHLHRLVTVTYLFTRTPFFFFFFIPGMDILGEKMEKNSEKWVCSRPASIYFFVFLFLLTFPSLFSTGDGGAVLQCRAEDGNGGVGPIPTPNFAHPIENRRHRARQRNPSNPFLTQSKSSTTTPQSLQPVWLSPAFSLSHSLVLLSSPFSSPSFLIPIILIPPPPRSFCSIASCASTKI